MNLIYLDGVQLPVAPAKVQIKIKNQNKTLNLINDGEINIPKVPGLTEISFEILLPNQPYSFASYPDGYQSSQYYLNHFEKLKTSGKAFEFTMIHASAGSNEIDDFNMLATFEEYTITESADEGRDFTVTLQLKQFKTYGTVIVTFEKPKIPSAPSTGTVVTNREAKKATGTYTVQSGDTMWGIAKKTLGDGSRWKELYALNATAIEDTSKKHGRASSSQGKWIYTGTVLSLPS